MGKKKRKPLTETVVVICEGASEYVYLQEINRFFREHKIRLAFAARVIGSGVYKAAVNRYRDVRRELKDAEIVIWVDRDIYLHSQKKLYENKPDTVPDFLFSRMNFEDFLALHMDRRTLMKWQAVCEEHHHFSEPLPSGIYLPLYRVACFPAYKKGKLPFKITDETLGRLFANLKRKQVRFKCDFGTFLEERMRIVEQQDEE
ncbi:hypothetical protein [Oxalobacter paraformigenes]|uniref:DUF4276 family protein n=1 Tax=Oxalobacter paraformigenes TaxID=556268 RepID=C3X3Z6_9BURK|nr:hypothetical protein [Oxalobacter paraformigenes]EEO27932.1 hypothetical protein OFAG_01085 [Oxalobacter paraformigenes]